MDAPSLVDGVDDGFKVFIEILCLADKVYSWEKGIGKEARCLIHKVTIVVDSRFVKAAISRFAHPSVDIRISTCLLKRRLGSTIVIHNISNILLNTCLKS